MENAKSAILRLERKGKPYFRMNEIARIQASISSNDPEPTRAWYSLNPDTVCHYRDSFGNLQSGNTKKRRTPLAVELRSLQYTISRLRHERKETPFYSVGQLRGDPADPQRNPSLEEWPDSILSSVCQTSVQGIFNEGMDQFFRNNTPPKVLQALSSVEHQIDNIVCFDLGTFEADERGPHVSNYGENFGRVHHHLLAIQIRDLLASQPGRKTPPELVFQHLFYTDYTTNFLQGQNCQVIRDNTTAFRHITENTLVIWAGIEGPMPVPVKQVIADFPFQDTPLPLPIAMLWPEEHPANDPFQDLGEVVDIPGRWVSHLVHETARTNQLHTGYKANKFGYIPLGDPFRMSIYSQRDLTLYTRK
ncbi:hypothetical protein F4803DRAFT_551769 [Xylaria telfairii]|nr:hypothetical protein F4803DRAFT_551769 [Xylaria telfairii]